MLTKERCMLAFSDVKKYGENNIPSLAIDILNRLIEEHFTPRPFNVDELRKSFDESKYGAIHVYDKKNQVIILITELTSDGELFVCSTLGKAGCSCVAFEDNRFYPIAIPKVMEE